MQDAPLYADDTEKGFMARPLSYFCPGLNYIQMGAWKLPLGWVRSIWKTYGICQVLKYRVWIVDMAVKSSREKSWRNYGCMYNTKGGGRNKTPKDIFL